ncbi:MAG: COX15/CtaA family protein [Xanthomonadales bacterium]|nr:COX15/CtaA family protein [Xanthomonadales bacterium]
MSPTLHRLAVIATVIAFCVIILGAYVRLSHAGLGCPDWPGCYGKLTWPTATHEVQEANQAFPERPMETHKAWKEMVHRYLAGALVLLVVAINVVVWRSKTNRRARGLTGALLVLILFQAALGMWTVTLKLWPIVVMGHLLGGVATFGLLLWLALRYRPATSLSPPGAFLRQRGLIIGALMVLLAQLALGGWTSANYAALSCPDFPTCQGELWPQMNFRDAFTLSREVDVDYEGGVLDLPSRTAIQVTHRLGALVTLLVLGFLAIRLWQAPVTRRGSILLAGVLATQITLGVLNIVLYLPLANAVAHNGAGVLLAATLIWLLHRATPGEK